MKNIFIVLLFSILFFTNCQKIHKKPKVPNKKIHNTQIPSKGTINLKLKKKISISALQLNSKKPPMIADYYKDKDDIYFLTIMDKYPIYKFNKKNRTTSKFISQGEGPGEIHRVVRAFQIKDGIMQLSDGMKFLTYNTEGKFIKESLRFKTPIYGRIKFIDEDKFISIKTITEKESSTSKKKRIETFALFEKKTQKLLRVLFRSPPLKSGPYFLKMGKNEMAFSDRSISRGINYKSSLDNNLIYFYHTSQYKIYIKNLQGQLLKTVSRKFIRKTADDNDKQQLAFSFSIVPDNIKKELKQQFPNTLAAISEVISLPDGYFIVSAIKGVNEYQLDLYNREGKYLYILKLPENLSLTKIKFTSNTMSGILETEDGDVYQEYQITKPLW